MKKILTLLSVALPLAADATPPTSITLTVSTITTSYSGDVKIVADIDFDGKPDVVIGGSPSSGGNLRWFRNSNWTSTSVYTPSGEITEDGAAADIDADGDLDLIITDCNGGTTNTTKWIENPLFYSGGEQDPTNGALWAAHTIGTNSGAQKDVRVADFDGDGKLDVVVHALDHTTVYFQNSPTSWSSVHVKTTVSGEDEGMDVGDIDLDGKVDIAVYDSWLKNPGNRTSTWTAYAVTNGTPNQAKIVAADLDQDGYLDIVYSDAEYHSPVKWCNAGGSPTGSWTAANISSNPANREHVHTLQVADWNGDTVPDVITGEGSSIWSTGKVVIYLGDGGSGAGWTELDDTNTNRCHQGQVVDIDGDGDLDIVGGGYAGQYGLYVWKQ